MADLKELMMRDDEKNSFFFTLFLSLMEPTSPTKSPNWNNYHQPYTTFRPWNLQRLKQGMSVLCDDDLT